MDAILHIEPIVRQTPCPLRIGHKDYVYYGTKAEPSDRDLDREALYTGEPPLDQDDHDFTSTSAGSIQLGCPLESIDTGSTRTHVPLIKTFECHPDESLPKGNVYTETLHYQDKHNCLIPYRTKIRNGLGQGLRLSYLPNLNHIRTELTGCDQEICDPRSDVLLELLMRDKEFQTRPNPHLQEWLVQDLTDRLSRSPINRLSFDTSDVSSMTRQYIEQVHRTPSDFTSHHLKDIAQIVAPEAMVLPLHYQLPPDQNRSLRSYRQQLVPHNVNLRSFGRIPLEGLPRVDYNPFYFQPVCEMLDEIPLTDFNVDMVLTCDNDIEFYLEHIALDRIGLFSDNEAGLYQAKTILEDYLTPHYLNKILDLMIRYHSCMTPEIEETIIMESIKIKVIKTITDEAIVLLYKYNSGPQDPPLCGVYFDIALQSLAPMSIIPQPILN